MALRGTLGDFGISDIFQLVGHQTKTGILLLKNRDIEVRISFVDGNVVKAEQSIRDKRDLLGNILVRAGVLPEAKLDEALQTQQRTGRRLGDVLVEMNAVDRATIREFARLQTTETIYRLFTWNAGTYEFTQQNIEYDEASYEPIRAENILMEGFRMVDEWPAVKKIVPSPRCSFAVVKPLPDPPPQTANQEEDILAGIDDAFGDGGSEDKPKEYRPTAAERRVFALVAPDRQVQEIVDRSRLGEFETTKSLVSLVQAGYLTVVVPPEPKSEQLARIGRGVTLRGIGNATLPIATRIALYAVVAAAVGGMVRLWQADDEGMFARDRRLVARTRPVVEALAELQRGKVARAIEVYRLVHGQYPDDLDALVVTGLLDDREIRFPYDDRYAYRRDGSSYVLAPPFR
jgi:hypothetical protein